MRLLNKLNDFATFGLNFAIFLNASIVSIFSMVYSIVRFATSPLSNQAMFCEFFFVRLFNRAIDSVSDLIINIDQTSK